MVDSILGYTVDGDTALTEYCRAKPKRSNCLLFKQLLLFGLALQSRILDTAGKCCRGHIVRNPLDPTCHGGQ